MLQLRIPFKSSEIPLKFYSKSHKLYETGVPCSDNQALPSVVPVAGWLGVAVDTILGQLREALCQASDARTVMEVR